MIKVGLVGKRNFLPIQNSVPSEGVILTTENAKASLIGGFESDIEGLYKFSSLNEMLLQCDAIIINDLMHSGYQELKFIIRHCKHVFINDPFPLSTDEIKILNTLAEEADVVVQMGLQHRFSDLFISVKDKEIIPRLIETSHFRHPD